MEVMRQLLKVSYRVYFTTTDEMNEWLSARGYKVPELDFLLGDDKCYEYTLIDNRQKKKFTLKVKKEIFNIDGKLKVYTKEEWRDDLILLFEEPLNKKDDDDLPF